MGKCVYCGNKAGFSKNSHSECQLEHFSSAAELLTEGTALMSTSDHNEIVMKELDAKSVEALDTIFLKQSGEYWLWKSLSSSIEVPKTETKLSVRPSMGLGSLVGSAGGKIEENVTLESVSCSPFAITNKAIYGHVSEKWFGSDGKSFRWPYSSINQIFPHQSEDFRGTPIISVIFTDTASPQPSQFNFYPGKAFRDPLLSVMKKFITMDADGIGVDGTSLEVSTSGSSGSIADELKKLAELMDQGILTAEEFSEAKANLLKS